MTQDYRCPRCRSLIELIGYFDLYAPGLQSLTCPVCFQEWWISSDFPPKIWTVGRILEKNLPAENVQIVPLGKIPEEFKKPVFEFKLPEPFKEAGKGIYNIGIWIAIILILIFLIKKR